ncbi:MAG: D-cysteine desulfhydrase family protein [Chloroflexota bacterium]|nr:MAG: D-cysteine desulfhydrase family protein [Chloroflexota bacterium]
MNISSLPRFPLAVLPTPLDKLPRLSHELGVRVVMKRDDLTGFAMGGNKARKLEFLVADALEKNCDVLVTGGGVQSNHIRTTAAAARKAGMDAVGVFFASPSGETNGNLLLDEILGAQLIYAQADKLETELVIQRVCDDLRAQGKKPYLIPVGGSTKRGVVSYILAVQELLAQLQAQKISLDAVVITTGSCGTHAGVLAGMKIYGVQIPVHGITVSRPRAECLERLPRLLDETAQFLEHEIAFSDDDLIVHDEYIGEAYAKITPAARAAIQRVARAEGIFLDPVYTGKAMAGLIDLVERGIFKKGSTILFWHTGGAPGIFGFPNDILG